MVENVELIDFTINNIHKLEIEELDENSFVDDGNVEFLSQENEYFKQQAIELNEKIEILLEQKKDAENKNIKLKKQIDELLEQQKNVEYQMDRVRENSTLSEMKIEPKVYIKGMFDHYVFDKNALSIYIDGNEYFYPLKSYQGRYLPMSGSRVLIFKSSSEDALVYGFDTSKLIEPIKKIKAEIKSFLPHKLMIKLRTVETGFIDVVVPVNFFEQVPIKIGDSLILNQIMIDGDEYFTVDTETTGTSTRDSILKLLL